MHTQHSEKSRRLAIKLLHSAHGVTPMTTMAEHGWAESGGEFREVFRDVYGREPDYQNEPQQRFLDVVAEAIETLTALSPFDPAEEPKRRAEHAARYELHKRTLDELACILHGLPEDCSADRQAYTLDGLKARARIFYNRSLELARLRPVLNAFKVLAGEIGT